MFPLNNFFSKFLGLTECFCTSEKARFTSHLPRKYPYKCLSSVLCLSLGEAKSHALSSLTMQGSPLVRATGKAHDNTYSLAQKQFPKIVHKNTDGITLIKEVL